MTVASKCLKTHESTRKEIQPAKAHARNAINQFAEGPHIEGMALAVLANRAVQAAAFAAGIFGLKSLEVILSFYT